jgi:hypothetical protein
MKKINLLFLLIVLFSCKNENKKNLPDVSNIEVNTNIIRFDKMLTHLDTNNIEKSYEELLKKEQLFTEFYFKYLIPIQKTGNDLKFYKELKNYLGFSSVKFIGSAIDSTFNNMDKIKTDFDQAFKYYKYYFPQDTIPKVYTFQCEYSYAAIIPSFNNAVGVGLEMFLGSNHKEYTNPQLNFPEYLINTFDKKYIVSRTIYALVEDKVGAPSGNRLLDMMIENGKKLYLTNLLIPNEKDSIIHEYTGKQMQWVNENEEKIWTHLNKEKLIYSTKIDDIQKLISISPNSPGMPTEAPGRTANFVGLKIIEQFMQRNPSVTIEDLLKQKDAQKILEMAKYKPDR